MRRPPGGAEAAAAAARGMAAAPALRSLGRSPSARGGVCGARAEGASAARSRSRRRPWGPRSGPLSPGLGAAIPQPAWLCPRVAGTPGRRPHCPDRGSASASAGEREPDPPSRPHPLPGLGGCAPEPGRLRARALAAGDLLRSGPQPQLPARPAPEGAGPALASGRARGGARGPGASRGRGAVPPGAGVLRKGEIPDGSHQTLAKPGYLSANIGNAIAVSD